jgi:hypothetical protein
MQNSFYRLDYIITTRAKVKGCSYAVCIADDLIKCLRLNEVLEKIRLKSSNYSFRRGRI